MKLPNQRRLFDIPDDVAYLNCAYMSPLMRRVHAAAVAGLARKARPWEIVAHDFFSGSDALRAAFAELVNVRADDIAIVPAVSYGVSTAARNLPLQRGHLGVAQRHAHEDALELGEPGHLIEQDRKGVL